MVLKHKSPTRAQVSSVSLASEDPVDEDSPRNKYLGIADYFFTGDLQLLGGHSLIFVCSYFYIWGWNEGEQYFYGFVNFICSIQFNKKQGWRTEFFFINIKAKLYQPHSLPRFNISFQFYYSSSCIWTLSPYFVFFVEIVAKTMNIV